VATAPDERRKTGAAAENEAAKYLRRKGYRILCRNYAATGGEIDLIAFSKGTVVFVEVKYRSRDDSGSPLEAIDERKRKRARNAAAHYIAANDLSDEPGLEFRFDAVGITEQADGKLRFEHVTDTLEPPRP